MSSLWQHILAWFAALFGRTTSAALVPVAVSVAVPSCAMGCVAQQGAGDLAGMVALGATIVRVTFFTAQDTTPAYRVGIAQWLAAFDAAGVEPVIVVHDFPTLASVVPAMVSLTTSFPNRTWQVGNEWEAVPNPFCSTGGQYAVLMQQVVAACPGVRFAGMGLATTPTGDAARWTTFAQDYFAARGPTLAAWCIHAYRDVGAQVATMQSALLNRWPLWVTEYNVVPIPLFAGMGVSRAYWYCYWDNGGPQGLVNADGSHRPAWDALHLSMGA
jgi:hypothetical protein